MLFVKYMPWRSIENESRDIREINLAKKMGYDTRVFSNDNNSDQAKSFVNSGISFIDSNITELSDRMTKWRKIIITLKNYCRVIHSTCNLHADVLSCHDLSSLVPAYISTLFTREKTLLIYDSHEYELGRNKKRSSTKKKILKATEGYLIKKCVFTIVVNDSIADKLVDVYSLNKRPIVVRSTPEKWKIDERIASETRIQICNKLGISGNSFITMYHGNIFSNRGIENYLKAVKLIPDVIAVLMGRADEKYLLYLNKLISDLGISERVLILDAVRQKEIWKYVGGIDVSIIAIPATCESYYYMLPNKFMESVQSLTPVIASDFPEIRKLVNKYKIGLLCNPSDSSDLASKIVEMKTNREQYQHFKENLVIAKKELCWENEQIVLQNAFNVIEKELICAN